MMDSILMSSGYPASVVAEAERHWHVTHITNQREALAHLRSGRDMPAAIAIGYATTRYAPHELLARDMLAEIHKLDPTVPVIISTAEGATSVIVDLVKHGAFDYVIEPMDHNDAVAVEPYCQNLILALTRAVQWRNLVKENQQLKQERIRRGLPESIQVRSPRMLEVMDMVHKLAPTSATVLITGESGTGKELIARIIHDLSPNRERPFTAINCGAISQTLLTSELFGHVRGAFTGADGDHAGLIRQAGTGTLFLDEIGTVSPEFQVMLLRVLDQRCARPVGGSAAYPVNCRFIAAANRDLEALVQRGEFRRDFFYRLNLLHVHLPPLRQRPGEIPVLAHHFLRQLASQYDKRIEGIDPAAMSLLESYHWPGNVRQLRNAIERGVILGEGARIGVADLDDQIRNAGDLPAQDGLGHQQAMRQFERRLLRTTLDSVQGNVSRAARMLDMKRTTLNYRIKQLALRQQP